ncbi:MAG: fatty acid desaturase family protein [Pseudomonadota bacterium]
MLDDYTLTSRTTEAAEAAGLKSPRWYRTKVDPGQLKPLTRKSDARAGRDAALWLGLMAGCAGVAIWLMPSWWALPFWLAYGVLYGSGSDARWHECGHRTAFRTAWMNQVIYHIASFMLIRNPVVWRFSHVRHHTDTIVVGRDPEIQQMRPPDLGRLLLNLVGLPYLRDHLRRLALHASGRLHPEEETYVKPEERAAVIRVARIWVAIFAATGLAGLAFQSWVPLLLIGGPRLYGAWHMVMTGTLQHLGLAENVTDHRLNTRTVLMNPVNRFLYLNMNYHLEHHMFTMVPYYHLPALHELVKHDHPAPDPSIGAAYRRLLPVLWRQLRYKDAVIVPELPEGAEPYRPEVDALRPHAM